MTSEADNQAAVRLAAAKQGVHLFRNNVGVLKDDRGVPVRYGLANDTKAMNENYKSADLIGITPVVVTQEMVGSIVGVFTSIEVKRSDWRPGSGGKREVAQRNWQQLIRKLGGIARIVKGELHEEY